MAGIQVAESNKSRRTPKAVKRIEIEAKLGGGHIVKHAYDGFGHEPREVHFNEKGIAKGGEHVINHIVKHAGLPGLEDYDKKSGSSTEEEIDA